MATQRINTTDVVASVEKYLLDNWPDSGVTFRPTAHEAFSGGEDEGDHWATIQWQNVEQILLRSNEDWQDFDFRILCWSRGSDRMRATRAGDEFAALLDDSTIDLLDRDDGTTQLGGIQFSNITVTPPQHDPRGVRMSVVSGLARVYLS